jgi:hypothetical protein
MASVFLNYFAFLIAVEFTPLVQDRLYLLAIDQVDAGIKLVGHRTVQRRLG